MWAVALKYWRQIAAGLGAVVAVSAAAWAYHAIYADGQAAGRNEVRAGELATCRQTVVNLQQGLIVQNYAVDQMRTASAQAASAASAAGKSADQHHVATIRKVRQIAAMPTTSCASAAVAAWEIVQ